MMFVLERPTIPPQTIRAGDQWSRDVDIWFNGELASGQRWTYVNAPAGVGRRFKALPDGSLVICDGGEHLEREEVRGTFEVRWRDDR
jgi:hypothetical protein